MPIAFLVLEDGSVHRGQSFGANVPAVGEVVFNTTMTGYQEVLTDPSYSGQMVTLTYPLIGNYGINQDDSESRQIQVSALIVRQHCDEPSHGSSESTIHEFLERQGIPGISGVDTRAITRRLRSKGVMLGAIASDPDVARSMLDSAPNYDELDHVRNVMTDTGYGWGDMRQNGEESPYRVLVTDCGLKYNILRELTRRGCDVRVVPADTPAEELLSLNPSGVLLSPGPGDPQIVDYVVDNARRIIGRVPVMGICLGHQVVARALGAETFKLKFGHRGGNHPVRDLSDGKVYITAQNHGYAVLADSLPPGLEVSHINLNDDTVEGLTHRDLPVFTIQYHSEASPGPRDNDYLFDRFLKLMDEFKP